MKDMFINVCSFYPGVQIGNLRLDSGTSYNFSNGDNSRQSVCPVCVGEGRKQTCTPSVLLRGPASVSLEFKCPKPEDVIHLEVRRTIGKDRFARVTEHNGTAGCVM